MAMTTSLTRSRRGEGLPAHHTTSPSPQRLVATVKAAAQANAQTFATNNHQRTKRKLDDPTRECDARQLKKARFVTGIAVEIPARASFQSKVATDTRNPPTAVAAIRPQAPREPQQPKPARSAAIAAPTTSRRKTTPPTSASTAVARKTGPAPAAGSKQQDGLTKHKSKVANGLKHELDRLQVGSAVAKDQGRKLRSQEATRFKSDLSAYFPDYDEVIGNDPKEQRRCPFVAPAKPSASAINC